jgi:hypothetical protein
MMIELERLAAAGGQGAALQAKVAPQLMASPSTLFFFKDIEYLEPSGAAVLLALIGALIIALPSCSELSR